MVFANNALDAVEIHSLAAALSEASPAPDWALVDAAMLEAGKVRALGERTGCRVFPGYAGSGLSAYDDVGVLLLALPREARQRLDVIAQLLALATPATALSWMTSSADVTVLQALCGYLGMASVEGRKQPIHCRFADTRVLPVLLAELSVTQAERVNGCVERWMWADRNGQHVQWSAASSRSGAVADTHDHLHLSIAQFRSLRAAAEPDAIFMMLYEQTPSLVPEARERGEFHGHIARILQTASGFGVQDAKSRLQFVVLSLSCGEDFHALPELQPTWDGVRAGEFLLVDKMPLWSNALWERLEYLRPEEERGVLP